jgi:hypothetical protein
MLADMCRFIAVMRPNLFAGNATQMNWPRKKPSAGSGVHLRGNSARVIGATL